MSDAYQRNSSCSSIFLIFSTTPSNSHSWQYLLFYCKLIDRFLWLNKIDLWILLFDETDNLWRVNARKIHMCVKLHSCKLCNMIECLTILSSTKSKVITITTSISKCQTFSLFKQIYRVHHFIL